MPPPALEPSPRQTLPLAVGCGAAAILCYFAAVVLHLFPPPLGRLAFFAIGPLSIVSVIALYYAIRLECRPLPLQIGVVMHVIAGAMMNAMAVVQAAQFAVLPPRIEAAGTEAARTTLTEVLWGVNVVQAGLDVSWDIFLSLGTVCLGIAGMGMPRVGRPLGLLGVPLASIALGFNLRCRTTRNAAGRQSCAPPSRRLP